MISKSNLALARPATDAIKQSGATLLTWADTNVLIKWFLAQGNFVQPTVFIDCDESMSHVQNEIFGPVMSVIWFSDETDVIARANNTHYGLAAGVFTQNLARAHPHIHQLQAGICWVNTWVYPPA